MTIQTSLPPIAPVKENRDRLLFLDALRGLAALYVVLYHTALIPPDDLVLPRWAETIVRNGGMGVTLFFVVSSFSLFYTMPLRLREPRPWASFFIHRFFRIAPLFYVVMIAYIIRDKLMYGVSHGMSDILTSATFVFNLVPQGELGWVWASWTIGIEMVFYALFPLFYLFARNRPQAVTMTLGLLVLWTAIQGLVAYVPSEPKTRELFLQWSFLKFLPVFGCGAIAYHLLMSEGRIRERSRDIGILLIVGALTLWVALVNGWLPALFGNQYYWQGLVFLCLLVGAAWAPVRVIVNRFSTYLGRISYSLYLNHPTLVLLLSPVYAWIYQRNLGLTISFLACVFITLAAAITVSEITYRFVEEPGIKLGKKVNRWLRGGSAIAMGNPEQAVDRAR
jgi:peptidoglycan/LPS O-acetylase OafA/YrhL